MYRAFSKKKKENLEQLLMCKTFFCGNLFNSCPLSSKRKNFKIKNLAILNQKRRIYEKNEITIFNRFDNMVCIKKKGEIRLRSDRYFKGRELRLCAFRYDSKNSSLKMNTRSTHIFRWN